ncbi:MAG: RimK family protein [Gammaproteobacteria bacterium]
MNKLYIIVEKREAWAPYYPSSNLITVSDYLKDGGPQGVRGTQIINLCNNFEYLGDGHYCSLLAEARGHRAIPSTSTLQDLQNHHFYRLYGRALNESIDRHLIKCESPKDESIQLTIFFGQTAAYHLKTVAKKLFELYPCPILRVTLQWQQQWMITNINAGILEELTEAEQTLFATAIDHFSRKIWRKPKARKNYRFEMAILHNPNEQFPPSDLKALRNFQRIGRDLGIDIDLITAEDYVRLLEYDALFIRETTAINHHTYHFAKLAQSEGLVVIDDPDSILRCTNKVFLAELLEKNSIPTPATRLLLRSEQIDRDSIIDELGLPIVLKIPDGSFSRGVVKAHSREELDTTLNSLFKESAILLAQEFISTEFDWRIGVLNGRAIFACQYFMARGHWQIYNHAVEGRNRSGSFNTLGVHQVPKQVVKTAIRSANLIGSGLYGVDLKQIGDHCVVIEVNDNPNIDTGVETAYLEDDLYRIILDEFLRRMEKQRQIA